MNINPPRKFYNQCLPWLLSGLTLLIGGTATLAYWHHFEKQQHQAVNLNFQAESERLAATISQQLNSYQVVMRGVQGFFQGSEQITYPEFLRYIDSLDITRDLRGVQGIGFAVLVTRKNLVTHLATVRRELPINYQITPPARNRDELAPIIYIEPLEGDNLAALGFDILSNQLAREAAEMARDTGTIVITSPLTLAQDQSKQAGPGFVMYLPVYKHDHKLATPEERRAALLGWVDVPFRVQDLLTGLEHQMNPDIDIEIHDFSAHDGHTLLFHGDGIPHHQRTVLGEWQHQQEINIGQRKWTLLLSSTPAFREKAIFPARPWVITTTGGTLSLALALLILTISQSRNQNQRRALRLGRLYHALSQVNQAIVRMDSEDELLPLVCQMAVEFGGMKMAWIGLLDELQDESTANITPLTSYGTGVNYINSLRVSICKDVPEGQGPTGTAMRENHPVVINHYLTDPDTRPWHERARQFGWKSAAAFPIQRQGKPFAVLNVYHDKPAAFDEDAINLLVEMSSDISFALDNFDRETQRTAMETALAKNEATMKTIMENIGACIYLKDTKGHYTFVNQQILELWNVEESEVIGFGDDKFFDPHTVKRIQANDLRVFEHGEVIQCEETDTVKSSGVTRIFWSIKLPLRDINGQIYALCGISTDITEHRIKEEKIRYLSNYDALTGLPNRTLLNEKAREALAAAKSSGTQVSLLFIDLDRFSIINDSLGHSVGDAVLKQLSQRLTAELNLSATLSRAGGDEFCLLLPGIDTSQVTRIAQQLLDTITYPVDINERRLTLTASIGIAFFPDHGSNVERLIQSADAALAQAKHKGRNNYQIFNEVMRSDANETLLIENELREAIGKQQLTVHYQPQVDMQSGQIFGVEALVRWEHPEMAMIYPGRFIPIAEESGLIVDIGNWVLETAVRQQATWLSEGLPLTSIAVNLSAVQIYKDNFSQTVDSILEKYQLPHVMLELELTERIAMEHSSRTLITLHQLQALGITLSIDDFGTGYSSLSYLKSYPVKKLKIDKSFVDGLGNNAEDQAIVVAIIGIAKGLGFKTVAKGVETKEQWKFLQDHGCDEYQGYFFSKPVAAEFIPALFTSTLK
ncbi:bifunctional diguanylate cyclase/phosphodiesterase [Porticoccus sp.]|uniref:bifunctional diguanylate cyclase/phosphodiesterase n=1 Tax=Porticoccus sp. TaxID=2024853 RepID=UPI003F698377